MGLEENVKAYADQARQILLARQLKSEETKAGKAYWQGYSTDGRAIVKQDGKFKAVRVVGNASVPKDKVVYIDETNTVDVGYVRKTEARQERVVKKNEPLPLVKRRRPVILVDEADKPLEIPAHGFHVVVYTKRVPETGHGAAMADGNQISAGTSPDVDVTGTMVSRFFNQGFKVPAYPATTSTYGIVLLCAVVLASSGTTQTCSASISGEQVDLSVEATSAPGFQDWEEAETDPLYFYQSGANRNYLSYTYSRDAGSAGPNYQFARAQAVAEYRTLPDAIYYYDIANGSTRAVNLNFYFSEDIVDHEIWHNFVTREGQNLIAYTIFYVRTATVGSPEIVPPEIDGVYNDGQISHWWLHLRFNLTTGKKESNRSVISTRYDGTDWISFNDRFIARYSISNGLNLLNLNCFFRETRDAERYDNQMRPDVFDRPDDPDVSGLFSNAFDGDWLSSWSGVTGSANINDVLGLLQCSYKNGRYYRNADSLMPLYWDGSEGTQPFITEYEPPESSNFYDGAGGADNDISTFLSELNNDGTTSTFAGFYDGTAEGDSMDIANWVRYGRAYEYRDTASGDDVMGRFGPPANIQLTQDAEGTFDLPGFVDSRHGERMHRDTWSSFVPEAQ